MPPKHLTSYGNAPLLILRLEAGMAELGGQGGLRPQMLAYQHLLLCFRQIENTKWNLKDLSVSPMPTMSDVPTPPNGGKWKLTYWT